MEVSELNQAYRRTKSISIKVCLKKIAHLIDIIASDKTAKTVNSALSLLRRGVGKKLQKKTSSIIFNIT